MRIGFIGQGWIGKHYANDFEQREYDVVRYGLEPEYEINKNEISLCDIVFIAVPTPTTETGFDDSIVRKVIPLVGKDKIAVIKSTIVPGTTESIQKEFPDVYVLHSPEFLVEATAAYDAAHPNRNIIGIPVEDGVYREKAQMVLNVLPDAPYETIMRARDAEFVKYAGNNYLFMKVMYMNLLYDLVIGMGGNWEPIKDALIHDPRIGRSHMEPVHKGGRGAGGHCFIKDFEAYRRMYDELVGEPFGTAFLKAAAELNIKFLTESKKDLDLLQGVYGDLSKYEKVR
jgi:nucleotide sugar dehydrogenase